MRMQQNNDIDRGTSLWQDAWHRLRKNRLAVAGAVLLGVVVLLSVAGPMTRIMTHKSKTGQHSDLVCITVPLLLDMDLHGVPKCFVQTLPTPGGRSHYPPQGVKSRSVQLQGVRSPPAPHTAEQDKANPM